MQATRNSLLLQLSGTASDAAWAEFLEMYRPLISRTIRKVGIPPGDIDDAVQEVLLQLMQAFPQFSYQKRRGFFRSWLRQVTTNKAIDLRRRHKLSSHLDAEFPDTTSQNESDVWLREFRIGLLQSAMISVEPEFRPKTWQCFLQHAIHRETAARTAEIVGVSENAVYINTNRVMARLREFCEFHGEALCHECRYEDY